MAFITREAFEVLAEQQRPRILTWDLLPMGKIYKVLKIRTSVGKFGKNYIAHISDSKKDISRVWAPARLVTDLKELRKPTDIVYIVSLGKEKFMEKTLNKFDLVLEPGYFEYKIFQDEQNTDDIVESDEKEKTAEIPKNV